MGPNDNNSEKWLTLSEAARLLDVHPTTIRRWANNGNIPALVTPGGHRRFSTLDLARFARERSGLRTTNGLTGLWATKALANARHEVLVHRQDGWLAHFEDQDNRNRNRVLGQRLLGLTLQYLSSESDEENSNAILDEARIIGRQYALYANEEGLPLHVALEASMFFRDSLIETALEMPEAANIRPEANVRLFRRINNLLNAVHLAVADVYQQAEGAAGIDSEI